MDKEGKMIEEPPKDYELPKAERRPDCEGDLVGILIVGLLGMVVGVIGTLLFLL